MRDLDLTSLRLFVAVCETGNIARAGEQEHIVASAISKRLAQLENTVGAALLVRGRRGVLPTPAGLALLEHARAMQASVGRIERDLAAYASGIKGHVRILASASSIAESLPEDVALFLQDPAHRDIQVDMEERVSAEVVRGLKDGSASVGVCWDVADFEDLASRPYRSDHLAVVTHPGHALATRKTLRFEQTLGDDHVGLPPSSAVQIMLQRAAARAGKPLAYRAVVSTFDAAMRVVRANLAICVVPREVAEPYAQVLGLTVIPLTDAWAKRRFAICFRDYASLSPAARLLTDHLVAQAR
ncbi:LysR family transcriptional regulator [Polaromonas sp. UC242_47]|uniref:LysR family transcriptional regulator n=1 Tax=Polaromonas sp. UC242_47 TaxID=3374626 RepID=UPI0037BC97DC